MTDINKMRLTIDFQTHCADVGLIEDMLVSKLSEVKGMFINPQVFSVARAEDYTGEYDDIDSLKNKFQDLMEKIECSGALCFFSIESGTAVFSKGDMNEMITTLVNLTTMNDNVNYLLRAVGAGILMSERSDDDDTEQD